MDENRKACCREWNLSWNSNIALSGSSSWEFSEVATCFIGEWTSGTALRMAFNSFSKGVGW